MGEEISIKKIVNFRRLEWVSVFILLHNFFKTSAGAIALKAEKIETTWQT